MRILTEMGNDVANSQEILIKRIQERLRKLNWSARELGQKAGIGDGQISRYLNKVNAPTLDAVDRIAGALGVSSAWLLSEGEITEPIEVCVQRVSKAALRKTAPPIQDSLIPTREWTIGELLSAFQEAVIKEPELLRDLFAELPAPARAELLKLLAG